VDKVKMINKFHLAIDRLATEQLSQKVISIGQLVRILRFEHYSNDSCLEEILRVWIHIHVDNMKFEGEVLAIISMFRPHIAWISMRDTRVEMELLRNKRHVIHLVIIKVHG
jgi:hypothetical protein